MKRKKSFTLIELLVVVAIISVLIAILLPALAAARDKAKGASCLSNPKQISMAVQMYANDYNDVFPYPADTGKGPDFAWALRTYCIKPTRETRPNNVWRCPSDLWPWAGFTSPPGNLGFTRNWSAATYQWPNSGDYWVSYAVAGAYGAYYYIGWGMGNTAGINPATGYGSSNPGYSGIRKLTKVTDPAATIALGEYTYDWSGFTFGGVNGQQQESWSMMPGKPDPPRADVCTSDRHSRGSNLLFVDGHAEWSKVLPCGDPRFQAYR